MNMDMHLIMAVRHDPFSAIDIFYWSPLLW